MQGKRRRPDNAWADSRLRPDRSQPPLDMARPGRRYSRSRRRHRAMTRIGRAPHDAVHDCGGGRCGYNDEMAARSNDAAFPGRPQMAKWIRFEQGGKTGFGTLEGETIAVHTGDLF